MKRYVIGIGLKIPDNEAHTALATLQRLAVSVTALRRADLWDFESTGEWQQLVEVVKGNEALFNVNKHEVVRICPALPRSGEVWIEKTEETLDVRRLFAGKAIAGLLGVRHYTAWRLFGENGEPCQKPIVDMAVERLLCNPAIERAIT